MNGGNDGDGDGHAFPPLLLFAPLALYLVFFTGLSLHVVPHASMFVKRYARRHRICGLMYLVWLMAGIIHLGLSTLAMQGQGKQQGTMQEWPSIGYLCYDVVLGVLGVALTLSAAFDFSSHGRIKNPGVKLKSDQILNHRSTIPPLSLLHTASGALDETATVTQSEMIEHSFYQGLNLCQILFLHSLGFTQASLQSTLASRLLLLASVTLPWEARALFPVNSFSKNYIDQPTTLTRFLYRIKKYQ